MGWGAALAAGAAIVGGLLGSKSDKKSLKVTKQTNEEAKRQFELNRTQKIQDTVKDAAKAGIHPLFALGGSAGTSPTAIMSGQDRSGSALGRGIAEAGRVAGRAIDRKKSNSNIENAQIRSLNSSADRDAAEAGLATSRMKREQQLININQDALVSSNIPGQNAETELPPELYIQVRDNSNKGRIIWLPNPNLGIEMPETLGAFYWAGSKLMDARTKKPVSSKKKAELKRLNIGLPPVLRRKDPIREYGAM